jgi:hypothetical protein
MPAAAAVPERKAVGRDQKQETEAMTPQVAMVRAAKLAVAEIPGRALAANAPAATKAGTSVCQRRSPVRSERRPTKSMTPAAGPRDRQNDEDQVMVSENRSGKSS